MINLDYIGNRAKASGLIVVFTHALNFVVLLNTIATVGKKLSLEFGRCNLS